MIVLSDGSRGRGNTVPLRLEIVDAVRVQNGAAWIEYSKAWMSKITWQ